jgi:hypothetical protein
MCHFILPHNNIKFRILELISCSRKKINLITTYIIKTSYMDVKK